MAHRTRNVSSSTIRIDGKTREIVERFKLHTGWTDGKAAALLILAGISAMEEREKQVAACRQLMEAAVTSHVTAEAAKKNMAKPNAVLAAARKQLKQLVGGAV